MFIKGLKRNKSNLLYDLNYTMLYGNVSLIATEDCCVSRGDVNSALTTMYSDYVDGKLWVRALPKENISCDDNNCLVEMLDSGRILFEFLGDVEVGKKTLDKAAYLLGGSFEVVTKEELTKRNSGKIFAK